MADIGYRASSIERGRPDSRSPVASAQLDISVEVGGLRLAHPVLNGSGTFDAIAALRAFGERHEVAALELNVSCPNVESGLIVGEQPEEILSLVRALRPVCEKPLFVKLTPNVADPGALALAAEQGGAAAVSLVNTLRATAIDPTTLRPWLGAGRGGLSGPALRPIALEQVRDVAASVSIPVIGMGGIESGADALAFLTAGATAVAVGTASFRDPLAASRIRAELVAELEAAGYDALAAVKRPAGISTST